MALDERDGLMKAASPPATRANGRLAGPTPAALASRLRRGSQRTRAVARERRAATARPIEEGRSNSRTLARESVHRRALILADVVAAAAALTLALRASGAPFGPVLLAALPWVVVVNKAAGLYDRDGLVLRKTTLDEVPALFEISALFSLCALLSQGQLTDTELDSLQVLLLWGATLGFMLVGRIAARALARRLTSVERCLLIGDPLGIATVSAKLPGSRAKAEIVATIPLGPEIPDVDVVSFREMVLRHETDRVIVAPLETNPAQMLEFVRTAKAMGVRVSLVPRLFEVVGSAVEFDQLDGLTILGVRCAGLPRSSRVLKRGFDVVGATIAIVVTAPLMIAIAIAIRLDSPGPVFFRQIRVGRVGRRFRILKFRSMVSHAEALKPEMEHLNEAEGLFKIAADPRVTKVGRLLRATALDELPQFFNVWWGDMSLVGPRPLVVDEDAKVIGLDRSRLRLTPGMTGHWQVLGSTRIPLQEMLAIDYLYVANWSLWTDVKLLLRTIPLVLSRRGI
jgi:exopolysaccharide biosynthesis polyprenyl glycosylphosphotransferase